MQRLDEFVAQRHRLAGRYNQLLADLPLTLPWQHPDSYSGLHLYVIRLQLNKIKKTHRQVFEELREAGIGVNLHYIPVHMQPYYQDMGFEKGAFPEAERYYEEVISLPMFPAFKENKQNKVIKILANIFGEI